MALYGTEAGDASWRAKGFDLAMAAYYTHIDSGFMHVQRT
jgi:hypothetical protein